MAVGDESGYDAEVFTLSKGKMIRVLVHTDTAVKERVYGKQQVAPGVLRLWPESTCRPHATHDGSRRGGFRDDVTI
jgi:hypothetical protein